MLGGGLGNIAPGQWSDDTEMACGDAGRVAERFLNWYAGPGQDLLDMAIAAEQRRDGQAVVLGGPQGIWGGWDRFWHLSR